MDVVGDVGPDEPEATVFEEVFHIDRSTGAEVVEADNLVPLLQESLAQVRSEEARTSCDNCTSNPHDLSPLTVISEPAETDGWSSVRASRGGWARTFATKAGLFRA